MGRTRLRGVELAGVQLAIEVPSSFRWEWPRGGLAALGCAPLAPDIYVGVRVGRVEVPDWDPITYSTGDGTFDVGRVGDDWLVVVRGSGGRCERVARFDSGFTQGEVIISPPLAEAAGFPLAQPLLDVVLLHRIIREGGLLLQGTAVLREGRALVFLGAGGTPEPAPQGRGGWRGPGERRTCRVAGERLVLRRLDDAVRVYGLPRTGGQAYSAGSARLDAIHVVTRGRAVYAERLANESAGGELLQHVYAPVHDPECTERLMEAASDVARLVPVMKLVLPEEDRVVPFTWGQRQAALAFSAPAIG